MCWFDEDRCSDGLQSLRHYRYEVDPDTRAWSDKPAHDWSSHAADAFMSIGAAILPENTHRTGRATQFNGFDNISGRLKPQVYSSYREMYAN
jgi:phage terminase large subunit